MVIDNSSSLPEKWQWFPAARFGMFIHWGPYASYGRGEQVLLREHLDQNEYVRQACAWNPQHFDAREWAKVAVDGGFKYAVLTTRHHDGYCLWDSKLTDYTSVQQAPKRDFIREYVDAFREAGLHVGLYYSLADWRIPAYFEGPRHDPEGWARFRDYTHGQVRELLTNYGPIAEVWFDGSWPRNAEAWQSEKLVDMMRELQPDVLINNRLDSIDPEEGIAEWQKGAVENAGDSKSLGDFGTPEHHITAEAHRPWESCQVSTWRLWGYAIGERFRSADLLLDMLCEAAEKGGNLLLNVGPDSEGRIPAPLVENMKRIGDWLAVHGEAIYGTTYGNITEFVTRGRQTRKGNYLYLILRFWDGQPNLFLADLQTRVLRAQLLTTGQELTFSQDEKGVTLTGLPSHSPTDLFPVIKLECDGEPRCNPAFADRLWSGNPRRLTAWAKERGGSVWVDGEQR